LGIECGISLRVFHCDSKLAQYSRKIKEIKLQQQELDGMIAEVHDQLESLVDNQDPAPQLESLHEANEIKDHLQGQLDSWTRKISATQKEAEMPRSMMYQELKEVLAGHNLLEETPEESEPTKHEQPTTPPAKPKTPTASEAEQYAAEDAREEVGEIKTKMEIKLQDAHEKLANWENFYDKEYKEYCALVEEGTADATKTEFDVILFGQQREATRELIEAEEDFETAKQNCRRLGVVFMDPDQESRSPDDADDGYRVSMEVEMVQHVDRSRIERWMADKEDRPNHSTECDDWDSKTVDLCDSVSVVAEGKEKARINRWQAVCEERRVEVPTVPEDFDLEDHQ
jgi:hypothetical protein